MSLRIDCANMNAKISLSKGGRACRGIGKKFAVSPITGTGTIIVEIYSSPERGGAIRRAMQQMNRLPGGQRERSCAEVGVAMTRRTSSRGALRLVRPSVTLTFCRGAQDSAIAFTGLLRPTVAGP